MWVFTPDGFVSAVEDRDDPTVIMVRARDFDSIEALCVVLDIGPSKIVMYAGTDYPYRVALSREQWVAFATHAAEAVTYPNFKHEAEVRRGKGYADVLMQVWVAGLALTPRRVARKQRDAYDRRAAERMRTLTSR